jgi:hypothetical protein
MYTTILPIEMYVTVLPTEMKEISTNAVSRSGDEGSDNLK